MAKLLSELEREAVEYGIDLSLVRRTLRMTPDERIRAHQSALALAETLREAVRKSNVRPREVD